MWSKLPSANTVLIAYLVRRPLSTAHFRSEVAFAYHVEYRPTGVPVVEAVMRCLNDCLCKALHQWRGLRQFRIALKIWYQINKACEGVATMISSLMYHKHVQAWCQSRSNQKFVCGQHPRGCYLAGSQILLRAAWPSERLRSQWGRRPEIWLCCFWYNQCCQDCHGETAQL